MVYQTQSMIANAITIPEEVVQNHLQKLETPQYIIEEQQKIEKETLIISIIALAYWVLLIGLFKFFEGEGGMIFIIGLFIPPNIFIMTPVTTIIALSKLISKRNKVRTIEQSWLIEKRAELLYSLFRLRFKADMDEVLIKYQKMIEHFQARRSELSEFYFNRDTGLISVTSKITGEHISRHIYTKEDLDLYNELFN